ncbi:MAG TPA: SpoIIE family protein phosphatase [Candidatus Eisenbacteria bacterium]|nr:SpoIIE family protein phosphatase [Candidatus Eisenbacteria bacterium]
MRSLSSIPRRTLLSAALVFAAATILYTAVWVYYAGWGPAVRIGIEWKPEYTPYVTILTVDPNSPAGRAGLRPQDRILTINGYRQHVLAVSPAIAHGKPGDVVTFRIQRPGIAEPFDVPVKLEAARPRERVNPVKWLAIQAISYYPVPFLVVGLLVLFLRPYDRNAWLLAFMFGGFIAAAPVAFLEGVMPPWLCRFMLSYMLLLYFPEPAIFYWFFATFPVSSPIDQKFPRLKYAATIIAAGLALPFAVLALVTGSSYLAVKLGSRFNERIWLPASAAFMFAGFGLGLASLIWNSLKAPNANDRRKAQVMVWGTVASLMPFMVTGAIAIAQHRVYYSYPFWFFVIPIISLWLLPISFAYAVVKHRVLEIPVLLKRSARYFLVQRGFLLLILLAGTAATLLLARALNQYFPERSKMAVPAGAALGIFLVWGGTQMESRVTRRLDRAFFRSAYDTRQILIDLAAKTRNASNREQLAELLRHEIYEALHPSALAMYFRQRDGEFVTSDDVPERVRKLSHDLPVLAHMRERGQTWEIVPSPVEAPSLEVLRPLQPECLVPMLGRDGQLLGLAVLGPRLSEESYSGEDKRLLDSVANQAGVTLENIGLAENMAERLEVEHRARQEMDIARQVQSKLLPQKAPVLKTIDYAGACIQARAVGGDYYDFLDLGEGRVGFVLADVAGKGISAALLMANLQAHLRSQSAIVSHDFSQTLERVNRMFFESTESNAYATLFIGVYEDATRRMRYVNCGHNPPVIVRGEGVKRLHATATVLGLFDDWGCEVSEASLQPNDILAICTDGVLEAANQADEEFGEDGLVAALRAGREQPAEELLGAVIDAVRKFAPGEQADDLTLIVAKVKSV